MVNRFFLRLIRRLRYDDLFGYSAQIAFYLLVSLVPFMITLTTITYRLHLIDPEYLLDAYNLNPILPKALLSLINAERNDLTPSLVSLPWFILLILWFASRGVRAIMNGIHMIFRTRESRNIFHNLGLSFIYTIGTIVMTILFLILVVYGDKLSDWLASSFRLFFLLSVLFTALRYIVPACIVFLLFYSLYRTVPTIKEMDSRASLPGAFFATAAIFIVSPLFTWFSNSSTNYSFLYGSLSGVVIICTWLFAFGLILLLGAEINATIYEVKHKTVLVQSFNV